MTSISANITFFFKQERLSYLISAVRSLLSCPCTVDIFIYTNVEIKGLKEVFEHLGLKVILVYCSPLRGNLYLGWECRASIRKQIRAQQYDIYIYLEDDIPISWRNIIYFMRCLAFLRNSGNSKILPGFLRYEIGRHGVYMTDIVRPLNSLTEINGIRFAINNVNPYQAFWICDQKLGDIYINHYHWDLNNVEYYDSMAAAAIGLYSNYSEDMYHAVLPLCATSYKLRSCCLVNHLPNNYIESETEHGKLSISNALIN